MVTSECERVTLAAQLLKKVNLPALKGGEVHYKKA